MWQTIYENHEDVWSVFQKQETTINIDKIKQDIQVVLKNLRGINQGKYTSLIRKFSHLQSVKDIKEYLENMVEFLT